MSFLGIFNPGSVCVLKFEHLKGILLGVLGWVHNGPRQVHPLMRHQLILYEHLWVWYLAPGYLISALMAFCLLPLLPEHLSFYLHRFELRTLHFSSQLPSDQATTTHSTGLPLSKYIHGS